MTSHQTPAWARGRTKHRKTWRRRSRNFPGRKSEKIPTRSELLPFGPMEPFNAVGERHPADTKQGSAVRVTADN